MAYHGQMFICSSDLVKVHVTGRRPPPGAMDVGWANEGIGRRPGVKRRALICPGGSVVGIESIAASH